MVEEDVRLLLVRALGLDGQLGRHVCGVVVDRTCAGGKGLTLSSWWFEVVGCKRKAALQILASVRKSWRVAAAKRRQRSIGT